MKREPVIAAVKDLLVYLDKHCDRDGVLFRGQPEDRPLIPRLGRLALRDPCDEAERKMFNDFKRRALPHLEIVPDSDWDWLALAQHHGMATRLLDWTVNPLAALWHVVELPAREGGDGVLWVFAADDGDYVDPEVEASPFKVPRTRVFQPKHVTRRIIAQSGWFTVHKLRKRRAPFLALEANRNYRAKLKRLWVPARQFSDLRWDLDRFGVNAASLFPDIDGLCRHLQWAHSLTADEVE